MHGNTADLDKMALVRASSTVVYGSLKLCCLQQVHHNNALDNNIPPQASVLREYTQMGRCGEKHVFREGGGYPTFLSALIIPCEVVCFTCSMQSLFSPSNGTSLGTSNESSPMLQDPCWPQPCWQCFTTSMLCHG